MDEATKTNTYMEKDSPRLPVVVGILLVVGFFYPTAVETKLTVLSAAGIAVCFTLLLYLIVRSSRRPSPVASIVVLSMVPLLLLFSSISGLSTIRWGGFVPYVMLSMLYLTDLRTIGVPKWLERLWLSVNCVNAIAGLAIVLGIQAVGNFIIAHYAFSYDEMVSTMIVWHMPVLTFATHSLAAFFIYLLFWLNLETYKVKGKKLALALSVIFLFLILFLFGVTSIILFCIGAFQLLTFAWSLLRHKLIAFAILSTLLVSTAFVAPDIQWKEVMQTVRGILINPEGGLVARYLPGGTIYYDLQYIGNHPFSPVGLSDRSGFMFGDSGPVTYVLSGSLPLLFVVYGGLYYFLRKNLASRKYAYILFAAIFAFEIGFTVLTYFRMLCLLPVFVVYLNSLCGASHVSKPGEVS